STVGSGTETHPRVGNYMFFWARSSAQTVNTLIGTLRHNAGNTLCNYQTITGAPRGNPVGGWATLTYPNVTIGCTGLIGDSGGNEYRIDDSLSLTRGPHDVKFGVQFIGTHNSSNIRNKAEGAFTFPTVGGNSVP